MTETSTGTLFRTGYERRLHLVTEVLTRDSGLGTEEATRVAITVLSALDHMPETVR